MTDTAQSLTVFITGTSSGIGLATAILFHRKGWNVVAALRSPDEAPVELLSLDPSRLLIAKCDVTNLESIQSSVSATMERFGTVDCVINNAAFTLMGVFEGLRREKVLEVMNTNFIGTMDVTRAFLPYLRKAAKDSDKSRVGIINVGTGAATWCFPAGAVYCASKLAMECFTEGLYYELTGHKIFVKLVIPYGGAVSGTSFGKRAAREIAENKNEEIDQIYSAFREKTAASYSRFMAPALSADDVANKIYEAATDGSDKLRYFIGKDTRGFMKLEYGEDPEKGEEEYTATIRRYHGY